MIQRIHAPFTISALFLIFITSLVPLRMATAIQPDKVFVINEGAFGQANASVTVFYPSTGERVSDVFSAGNDRLLGDVANDAQWINGKLYIVVNNSHKIEVVDPQSYKSKQTIFIDSDTHGGSPRKILQVAPDKAYVTNLFGNNISVIDLASGAETGTIDVGPGPEGIVRSGGFAFVALSGLGQGNEVAVIDIERDELVTRLEVGDNPVHLAVAPDGNVWSVATGNYGFDDNFQYDPDLETFGQIVIINSATLEISGRFETGGHPGKLVFVDEDHALLQHDGLRLIDVDNLSLIEEPFLDRTIYSFDVTEHIHVSEPSVYITVVPDFASSGRVIRYGYDGEAVDSFQAGIGPGAIAFWYQEATGLEHDILIADRIRLNQNYPNPFNPKTFISYELPVGGHVRLDVYDTLGRLVATLVDGRVPAGDHAVTFNAAGFVSGLYLYRLSFEDYSISRQMLLIK